MFSYPLTPACTSPHMQDPGRSWESNRRQKETEDTSDIYWKKYDNKLKVLNSAVLYTCTEDNGVEVTKRSTNNQDIFARVYACVCGCVGVRITTKGPMCMLLSA
jgi:hypothetical protein